MGEAAERYQCPGEAYAISRAVHWGRLATFYPGCRDCPHRHDTGPLTKRQVKQLVETECRAAAKDLFEAEGVAGVEYNELTPPLARRFATAFAESLHDAISDQTPSVVLAGDGRAITIELLAAASDALRHAGCDVIDIGSTTSPGLAETLHALGATGGLLVGNRPSTAHTASLKFWGADGVPLSRGAGLERIESLFHQAVARGPRPFGRLRRHPMAAEYMERLRPDFHALRPLRIVLDTTCRPLRSYLETLTQDVACRFVAPSAAGGEPVHGTLWIDGDGERVRLFDEAQRPVDPALLLVALAHDAAAEQREPLTVVLADDAPPTIAARLAESGITVVRSAATHAAMRRALLDSAAMLGGGPSGYFWWPQPAAPDALRLLARLLVLLSRSDRPLSEVVAGAIFSGT